MARLKPLQALLFGAAAGALGSLVQNLFFKTTARIQPPPPKGAFKPPEPEQKKELPTETVARRVVEDLAQAGPLDEGGKKASRTIVHYAFGKLWGCAYAMARESMPSLASPAGAAIFGTTVWMLSDNLLLPSCKLSAWPHKVPAQNHAYALAAHLAYGAAVVGGYELLRARPWLLALSALRIRRSLSWLPEGARKPAIRAASKVWGLGRSLPIVVEDRS